MEEQIEEIIINNGKINDINMSPSLESMEMEENLIIKKDVKDEKDIKEEDNMDNTSVDNIAMDVEEYLDEDYSKEDKIEENTNVEQPSSDEEFFGFDEKPWDAKTCTEKIKEKNNKITEKINKLTENNNSEKKDGQSIGSIKKEETTEHNTFNKIKSPLREEIMEVEVLDTKKDTNKNLQSQQDDNKKENKKYSLFRKPLQAGWKRELVLRAMPTSSKDKGEAYYITPSGKKLRTKSEILQHLSSDLSIDMFTFVREPLGFGPDEEIIRNAKPTKTADSFITHKRSSNENNLGKRIPKPKGPKGASPPPHGWTASKAIKTSVIPSPRSASKEKNSDESESKTKFISKSTKQTKKNNQLHTSNTNYEKTSFSTNSRHKLDLYKPTGSMLYQQSAQNFASNFFGNLSIGCQILLQIFQYLSPQELAKAACVCRVWNIVANHKGLWRTIRMKNLEVNNWTELTTALVRNEAKYLNLRKMLNTSGEEMWTSFSKNIKRLTTLEGIDLEKCSPKVVERLFQSNPNLKSINAIPTLEGKICLKFINNLKNLENFKIKSYDGLSLEGDLTSLLTLKNLKHLGLTSFNELASKKVEVLSELTNLESLEFGDCTDLNKDFIINVLLNLKKLKRLRLEKISEPFSTVDILEIIPKLENLIQLELINFDVQNGFYEQMIKCKNLQKLLIIPTYVVQSATTIKTILKSIKSLSNSLRHLTWVVTNELMRVTCLCATQSDESLKDNKTFDESIPIIRPLPDYFSSHKDLGHTIISRIAGAGPSATEVQIIPIITVEKIIADTMPNTKVKILKVPFNTTWRQNLV